MKYSPAGIRYWSASILPALVGTTLPFWLKTPAFRFRIIQGFLFLAMALLGHIAFYLLFSGFTHGSRASRRKKQLFASGISLLTLAVLAGIYLNDSMQLQEGVPDCIFIVYGISVLFTGLLYVAPPFSFYRRAFGEVILGVGLGLLPVLGAYLVQVGDLTRSVYLASIPVVLSTGLWIWISELLNQPVNGKNGLNTLVMRFSYLYSGRIIPFALLLLIYMSLILAVIGRSSLSPFSLIAFASGIYGWKIMKNIRNGMGHANEWRSSLTHSVYIHSMICFAIIISSFISLFLN